MLENTRKSKAIPEQALGVAEGLGSQISWQPAHEGGVIVTGRLNPKEIFIVLISIRGWVDRKATMRRAG